MLLTTESRRAESQQTSHMFYVAAEDDGAERRRGLRLRQARPVKIFDQITARYVAGETEDISATGLRVTLPASSHVRPGTLLNVHVGLAAGGEPLANRRQMMTARVVWVDRKARSFSTVCAGIEFTASIAAHRHAA